MNLRDNATVQPPQALEAEQAVLGALLLQADAYDRIEFLRTSYFYTEAHRLIFSAIESLVERGRPCDTLLVAEVLEARGELERAGGQAYLGTLAAESPGAANIRRYAEIVRDRWLLREVIVRGTGLIDRAHAPGADAVELAREAEAAFLEILEPAADAEEVTLARAAGEAIDARGEHRRVIPTGLQGLDVMLKGGGLKAGQLVIVAGRSSMGKSALAWGIAEAVGKHSSVAYFSLEMSRAELADRALSYHEGLVGTSEAHAHLAKLRILIDESPAVTLAHLRLRCRRIKRKHGLGLIVVDYLQLMTGRGENRTQEIGSISRGLKAIAKEFQVPVIACAQINRSVESRTDRRPMMSDLRESGDIENDADIVLMLYRDEYYNPATEARGLAELLVRKQRSGRTGTVYLHFDSETTRFKPWVGDVPRGPEPRRGAHSNIADFKSRAAGDIER